MSSLKQQNTALILVDKEAGLSSFAVIALLRKIFQLKKIGHCGTLDPFATGLLPCLLGRGTGLLRYMEGYTKVYEAEFCLGERRNTMDSEGEVTASLPQEELLRLWQSGLLEQKKAEAVARLSGTIAQTPPMFSAVKVQGKALYKYARQGIELERSSRQVEVKVLAQQAIKATVTASGFSLSFKVKYLVSKGTYIRSLVDEIGELMGCHAYCSALRRLSCGELSLAQAIPTPELRLYLPKTKEAARSDIWLQLEQHGCLQAGIRAVSQLGSIQVSPSEAKVLVHGQSLSLPRQRLPVPEAQAPFLALLGDRLIAVVNLIHSAADICLLKGERIFVDHEDI